MKISILIPVYNASEGLPAALGGIAAQECSSEIEIIAVNDCSTDSSRTILENFREDFEKREGRRMLIVDHDSNKGVAAARNTALDSASGDWICWVDADDILEAGALSEVEKAKTDVVGWDWTLCSDNGLRYMRQCDCATAEDALKSLLGGTLRWNLWLFMVRRALFEDVRFTPGDNMGEDMSAMVRLLIKAGNFSQIHKALYRYRQSGTSISRTMSEKNLRETCANVDTAAAAIKSSRYRSLEDPYLDLLKLNAKLPLLVSDDKNDYLRWQDCYPESNRSIMKNPCLPLRTKLLQLAASKRMWIAVRIYNKLVYGLLYGVLACRDRS